MQAEEVVLLRQLVQRLFRNRMAAVEATTTEIEATDSMVAEATAVRETADATAQRKLLSKKEAFVCTLKMWTKQHQKVKDCGLGEEWQSRPMVINGQRIQRIFKQSGR